MRARFAFGVLPFVLATFIFTPPATAQSTATIQGTVTDAQGAVLPGATVTVRHTATGSERTVVSSGTGGFLAASLPTGHFEVTAHLDGFQDQKVEVDAGPAQTVAMTFKLTVAAIAESITVTGVSPVIETSTVSVGASMAERTVQEIPLNGRHFVDLGPLLPGGVTPPQNAGLSAPLRGQGSFSFISAGNRETSVNFMLNGINLNDLSNSQVTFQPTINTVSEFKVDNSTFSAEYGRNSGAIVNVATRSGANQLHGEVFDYYRDDRFDSRNFFNPSPNPQSVFNRKQFGLNLGGPIMKNKTFYFLSYEGLRHLQAVDLNSGVLTQAQRDAVTDPVSRTLLQYIPEGNTVDAGGQARLLASGLAPVNIDQYTVDIRHNLAGNDDLHVYYAYQKDKRQEPNAQGNTLPDFGDTRGGKRQILTVNETHAFGSSLVNEARAGFNRINITFDPNVVVNPTDLGMNVGIDFPIAMPQITIQSLGLNMGGPAGFPSGRTVTTSVFSDTATYLRGRHVIKFGGEYRRAVVSPFTLDPGTFTFPSVAAFQAGWGNGFSITLGDRASDLIVPAVGAFLQDSISLGDTLKLDLGLRYDFLGVPDEKSNKAVVFDAASVSLLQLGSGLDRIHKNGNDLQPRLGVIWNPTGSSKLVVRGAYAVMVNQGNTGIVAGATANPPLATPLQVTAAGTAASNVTLAGALAAAQSSGLAPSTTNPNFEPARMQTWNVNAERQFGTMGVMVGYFGSYGDRLRIPVNINQLAYNAAGQLVRPYPRLSASSPIQPNATLGNIIEVQSAGWSHYNGLWITANQRMTRGLQFSASYTLSKSTDTNSFDATGANANGSLQNSLDIGDSEGPSDFDVRHRFSINTAYELPFHGNRFLDGWQVVAVVQAQSGSPFNVTSNINTFTGLGNLRLDQLRTPTIVGKPEQWFDNTVCDPRTASGAGACDQSSVFALPVSAAGVFHFGSMGRNALIGPAFYNTDFSVIKNIDTTHGTRAQLRVEVFNLFNAANLGLPGRVATVGSTAYGVITSTRFPTGDSGSARQVQFAAKFLF
ncbi:MAG TPA: TonB-dependent receptor [Vicinamibacterales bacterium]|nr:TonB-dependent receptor [Vicinamibacterales bacterium]